MEILQQCVSPALRYGFVASHKQNRFAFCIHNFPGWGGGWEGCIFSCAHSVISNKQLSAFDLQTGGEQRRRFVVCLRPHRFIISLLWPPPSQIISIWISSSGGKTPLQDALPTSTFSFFFHLWLRSILLLPFYFGTSHDHKTFIFLASPAPPNASTVEVPLCQETAAKLFFPFNFPLLAYFLFGETCFTPR